MQRLCLLSLVAKAGFNLYLTYLYDKQHMSVVDREPYHVVRNINWIGVCYCVLLYVINTFEVNPMQKIAIE
jgi:hypothetical protein